MKKIFYKYRFTLIIGSAIILLPIIFGIIFWENLPDVMATHWGVNNEVNGTSSKGFTVFGMPFIMLAMQWICLIASNMDPKKENINEKIMGIVLWIIPVVSLMGFALIYSYALGYELNIGVYVSSLVGILIIIIGNYLPKCKQSYTMGIKVPWTLNDVNNWNATHRFAGPVWVICGFVMLICGLFIERLYILYFICVLVLIIVPVIYSYRYYKNHQ